MLRILIVDDYEASATMLALLLEDLGHEVATANDGPAALERFDEHRPDVVLLDIGLPGMDGFEVAERLRRRPDFGDTVLIALTGYPEEFGGARREQAGFDHYLIKSAELGGLQQLLARLATERA